MYLDFLRRLVTLLEAANASNEDSKTPTGEVYTDSIPVIHDGELVGFLRDEIGGEYNYVAATDREQEWWSLRPWVRPVVPPVVAYTGPCAACGVTNRGRVFCRQCGHSLFLPAPTSDRIAALSGDLTPPDTKV